MVERNLAKVEVESSRLFSRSNSKGSTLIMLPFFIEGKQTLLTLVLVVCWCISCAEHGAVTKRLCTGLQIRLARFDSGPRLHQAPGQQIWPRAFLFHNAFDMLFGPSGEIGRHSGLKIRRFVNSGRTGSTPVSGTIRQSHFKPLTFIWWPSWTVAHLKTG